MADRGHELTDNILAKLEQDIADEYAIAVRDMRNKLTEYLEKDEAKRQIQEKLLNDGAITQQEYNEWCYRHMMMGKRWENMLNALAKDMTKTKEIALKISREKQPDVCALNVNYATYQIEHDGELDTGLSLYNHDAAAHLLEEQRQLMPGPSTKKAAEIAANADMQWNYKKIQSAVLQGILQGESPYDVAKRLNTVGRMNYNDSVRYARTMTTNSQNAGRYQAFRRARDIGVDLTIEWQATLDGRTRHSHRMMHGQRRDVDEPFELDGVKIMWPGNDKVGSSDVPQSMIWNCRCTLLSWVKGFEGETVKESPKMGDLSFEEWQNEKASAMIGSDDGLDAIKTAKATKHSPESIRSLEDYAKSRGIRLVNAGKFDGESSLLKEQIDVVADYRDEFNVKRKLKIEIADRLPANALGEVNENGDVIRLWSPALRSRKATNDYLTADNKLSASDVRGIAAHEMGHVISKAKGEKGLYFAQRAYYNVHGTEVDQVGILDYLTENVSLYASEKKDSSLAKGRKVAFDEITPEIFGKHTTSPDAFTTEFVRLAKEMLGK